MWKDIVQLGIFKLLRYMQYALKVSKSVARSNGNRHINNARKILGSLDENSPNNSAR